MLEALPDCGALEVRLGHRGLLAAALAHVGAPRETRGAAAQLLATASIASPTHPAARAKRWPSIRRYTLKPIPYTLLNLGSQTAGLPPMECETTVGNLRRDRCLPAAVNEGEG